MNLDKRQFFENKCNKLSVLLSKPRSFSPFHTENREEQIIRNYQNQLKDKFWPTIYKNWKNAWYRLIIMVQVRSIFTNNAHQPSTSSWLTMKKCQKQPHNWALLAGVMGQAGNSVYTSICSKRGNTIVCCLHRAEWLLAERTRKDVRR